MSHTAGVLGPVASKRGPGRPKALAAWAAEALEVGLDPEVIRRKCRRLRNHKAGKFGVTTSYMEAVYGWEIDVMAASLVHAVKHLRCRGPRCNRVAFANLPLELVTCDILNPDDLPLWCVNVGWACSPDNKGDGARSLSWRISQLAKHRQERFEAEADTSTAGVPAGWQTLF